MTQGADEMPSCWEVRSNLDDGHCRKTAKADEWRLEARFSHREGRDRIRDLQNAQGVCVPWRSKGRRRLSRAVAVAQTLRRAPAGVPTRPFGDRKRHGMCFASSHPQDGEQL
jgi:hypothetical protein